MSLILRCVNILENPIKVEEHFVKIIIVNDTTREGLFIEMIRLIKKLELNISDIRGQGYDNESNMKGKERGVQKRLLNINLKAFYTPCGCHNLNFVLCYIANSCPKAISFFGIVQRIYTLLYDHTLL
jgi:hypothetical protein